MAETESNTAAKPTIGLNHDWIYHSAQLVGDQVISPRCAERLFRATMGLSGLLKLLDASDSARVNIEEFSGDFPVPIGQGLTAELRCAARFLADELLNEAETLLSANNGENCLVYHTQGPWVGLYSKINYGPCDHRPLAPAANGALDHD